MLILVVGAKGGLGTTSLAVELSKAGRGIALDLTQDRQLATRLERVTWPLSRPTFAGEGQRREALDTCLRRRVTLLWTPECALRSDDAWAFVSALADRTAVVADGGIEPPAEVDALAALTLVVTGDSPVAGWHTRRLKERYPNAVVTAGDEESIRNLAARIFDEKRNETRRFRGCARFN